MSPEGSTRDAHSPRARWGSGPATATVGAAVLGLAAYFFVMSNRTGGDSYEAGQRLLDNVASSLVTLDSTLFPLLFELRTDLDVATGAQRRLVVDTRAYEAFVGTERAAELVDTVSRKLRLVDDFKAHQAVVRNSRAIASEMIGELAGLTALRDTPTRTAVADTERAWLRFVSLGAPERLRGLDHAIEAAEVADAGLVSVDEWHFFQLHAEAQQRNADRLRSLLLEVYRTPVGAVLERHRAVLEAEYRQAAFAAYRFRLALFVVVVALLAFSGYKVLQVGRYVRLVRRSNEQLEHRVEARTAELSTAAKSLHAEMREREAVETQLRMAQKLEAIGQLAAGIAHEINTPTQYVSDNVNFLATAWSDLSKVVDEYERVVLGGGSVDTDRRKAVWDDADVEYLRAEVPSALVEAASGLKQIGRIVKAMKDFSHPGDESLQPADLNRAIESTVEVARNEWKYVAELELDLNADLPFVPCDLSAMNQVILNIVVNAAQAIGGGLEPGELGRIRISSRQIGGRVEVVVEDDGPGIPEAIRAQVFDPFFTTKDVGKGTGQGLAIAFRVVQQQHGGTLTVGEGRDGRGARFVIGLPLARDAATDAGAAVAVQPLAAVT